MSQLTYEGLVRALNLISTEKSEWAGIPCPVDGNTLVLERRWPYQLHIDTKDTVNEACEGWLMVNRWFSSHLRADVIHEERNGRYRLGVATCNQSTMLLDTLNPVNVWSVDAEVKAMEKLAAMVNPFQFKCYFMTGAFVESSKRSGVFYLFRRLRPTIAFRADDKGSRILTALCLHPVGFYQGTWAGVMVPTDDLLAHLILMRGDERRFWAQANHHPPHTPQSGL